jgi:hypothetical protein
MKKLIIMIMAVLFTCKLGFGQMAIPEIDVKNLEGNYVSTSELLNREGYTIILFWSSDDEESLNMLNEVNDAWNTQLLEEESVEIVGICINTGTRDDLVKPFIYGSDIQFANYIDENGSLKRALNISSTPFIMLVDRSEEMVYMHSGYCPGMPDLVCDQIALNKNNTAKKTPKYTMVGN